MKGRALCAAMAMLVAFSLTTAGCAKSGSRGTANSTANSKLAEVLKRGYLVVGTGSTNVPWHFKDEKGELVGMDIDMGRILAQGLFKDPTKVKFVEESPDARIPNILTDKVDIVFQFMTISAQRSQQVEFSVPYYTEGIGLILPTKGKYKSYADMKDAVAKGKKVVIAVLQNVDAAAIVQDALPGSKDDQYENQGLVYQAVDSGRADAGMVDLSSIKWLAHKQADKYLDSGFAFHPQNYGAAMRQNDQIWINFVNQVLIDAMCGESFQLYKTAYAKWFGDEIPTPSIGKPGMFR
jgi:polar amino acid transport system substrate-binding protein